MKVKDQVVVVFGEILVNGLAQPRVLSLFSRLREVDQELLCSVHSRNP